MSKFRHSWRSKAGTAVPGIQPRYSLSSNELYAYMLTHPYAQLDGTYALKKGVKHSRRIELEDKAKVVASVWGTESLPS